MAALQRGRRLGQRADRGLLIGPAGNGFGEYNRGMVQSEVIQEAVRRIVKHFEPEKVYLIGSAAQRRGTLKNPESGCGWRPATCAWRSLD